MLNRDNLHHYQKRAVDTIIDRQKCALWLDLGLGKSVITLTAISDLLDGFAVKRVLVIAPLRVARSVWLDETQKWEHLKNLRVSVCVGSAKDRERALRTDADIFVINRECVPWLVDFYGKKWPFDMLVIDESTSFKNPASRRFKSLRRVASRANYTVLLTGTPIPNGLGDLWSQFYLLDGGERLGRTLTQFRSRWFSKHYSGFGYIPNPGAMEDVKSTLSDLTLTMRSADYLELPSRVDITQFVDLPPSVANDYRELERELIVELDKAELVARNAAALTNKLAQMCNGAVITDTETKAVSVLHDEKFKALDDLMEMNENLLIAYSFIADRDRLLERYPDAVFLDQNEQTIKDWNDGKIKMLIAHPVSCGEGLNLQNGGSTIVWFGLGWALGPYLQFNGRLHRQGQTKTVKVIHLLTRGCIDEKIYSAIQDKSTTQADLLKSLKKSLKNIPI